MDQSWMNDDRDDDNDERDEEDQEPIEVVQEELDDEYAREYFRKFEPDPDYDKNECDKSYKSIRAVRKRCKERGLPFLRHNGYQQPARIVKDACMCRKFCYAKFLEDIREKLLDNLLQLSAEGQNTFLICHIEPVPANRPRHGQQQKSVRNYYLPSNTGRVRVCKVMFANTFDLSDKRVRGLNRKAESGAYDEWLRRFRSPSPEASSVLLEEEEFGPDVDDPELNSQDPIFNDHSIENQSANGSNDESDIEMVSPNAESDNVTAEPEPLLDDMFLNRYFQQLYEVDPMRGETSSSNTKTRRAVKNAPLEPCSCVVYQCTRWFTEEWRLKIYRCYSMMNPAEQAQFLQDHTKQILKKRTKTNSSRRNYSQLYFIPTKSGRTRVCKVMFLNTFRINDHKIRDLNSRKELAEPPDREETDLNPQKADSSNTRRMTSMFAFDPTLIDPLALTEAESPPRKRRKSSKLIEESQIFAKEDNIPRSAASTNPKRRSRSEITIDQITNSDADDDPSNGFSEPISLHNLQTVELDDTFLDEYFLSYENNDQTKVRKSWVNLDVNDAVPSACSCKKQCYSTYPDETRNKIFSRFVKLTPINKQRFLHRHLQVQRNPGSVTRKKQTCSYFLPSKSGLVKVCSIMFQNLYRVTDKMIRGLIKRSTLEDPILCDRTAQVDGSVPDVLIQDVVDDDFVGTDVNDVHLLLCPDTTEFIQNEEFDDLQPDVELDNDEIEVKDSCEHLNIDPPDEYDVSLAEVPEFSQAVLNDVELVSDVPNYPVNESVPAIPEIDDEFLDEYFIQFELNGDQEGLERKKIKPMTKGSPFDDHIVMEACTCVNFMCFTWLTDDLRRKLYGRFVRLSPVSQRFFIKRHMRREYTKRKKSISTRRNYSIYYFIPTRKNHVKVCKVMFMNTFKVTDKKLRSLMRSDLFEAQDEEIIFDETEVDTVLSSQDELLETDQFDIDIKEETGHLSDPRDSENIEQPPDISAERAPLTPSTIHGSDDELTLSETETAIEFEDALIDEYFAPYEIASDLVVSYAMKKRIYTDANSSLLQPCSCIEKCSRRYPVDLRIKVLTRFSNLSHLNQQRFLRAHISVTHRQRTRNNSTVVKKLWVYCLPAHPAPMKVCSALFKNTFQVTEEKLRLLMKRKYLDGIIADQEDEPNELLNKETVDKRSHFLTAASDDEDEDDKADVAYQKQFPEIIKESPLPTTGGNPQHDQDRPNVTQVELDEAFLNGYMQGLLNPSAKHKKAKKRHQYSSGLPSTLVPAACFCSRQCHVKYPYQLRQMIFDKYLELSSHDQLQFVKSHLEHRAAKVAKERSLKTYYLPSNTGRVVVCQSMFRNTFNLSYNQLQTIQGNTPDSGAKTRETGHDHRMHLDTDNSEDLSDEKNTEEIESNHDEDCISDSCDSFPREMNPQEFACSCAQQCSIKLPPHIRRALLDKYITLSKPDRMQFLTSCIKSRSPRKRQTKKKEYRRKFTYSYSLPIDGHHISVCKIMFCNVLCLGNRKLRTIRAKCSSEDNATLHDDVPEGTSEAAFFDNDSCENSSEDMNEMIVGE